MSLSQLFSDILKWQSLGENLPEQIDEQALKEEALSDFEREYLFAAYKALERLKAVQEDHVALKKNAEDLEQELRSLILEEKKEMLIPGGESLTLNLQDRKRWQRFCQEVRTLLKEPETKAASLYDRQFLSQESDDLLHFFDISL